MKNVVFFVISFIVMFSTCTPKEQPTTYDLCIYGGTSAGIIAGYAAEKLDMSVIVIEPSNHIGGLTTGGLGRTDIGNKYTVVGLSRDFYRQLGDHYNAFEQWNFEPSAASRVFNQYINEVNLDIRRNHRLVNVQKSNRNIQSITCSTDNGEVSFDAKMFMDCTYEGDLLAKSGVSYTVGRESNDTYNETYNGVQLRKKHQFPDGIDPYNTEGDSSSGLLWGIQDEDLEPRGTGDDKVQAYNFRICLTDSVENMIPITRPENYDSTMFDLLVRLIEKRNNDNLYSYFIWSMMPHRKTDINNRGGFSTDMIGMNWDYPEASYEKRKKILQEHLDYTKGLLYFWGHDPRVPKKARNSMLKWGYPKDEYVDNDHFTPQLYVREARRMIGEYVMTEHHCVGDSVVADPIALAAYTMDSHNCQRLVVDGMVKNEGNVEIGGFPPYPISYRSITPKEKECTNLLVPVCLSASHIAFGSIRMEPVFMVLGQVAAIAANEAMNKDLSVQDVDYKNIKNIMETNPLLDGTPPDILVDNNDAEHMKVQGAWDTASHWMSQYKHNYLISEEPSGNELVDFHAEAEREGSYHIYFYVPRGNRGSPLKYSQDAQITIETNDEETMVPVNLQKNRHHWVSLGIFNLTQGEQVSVTIRPDQLAPGAIIADAVLIVPVQY
jgi:hypothetical protein